MELTKDMLQEFLKSYQNLDKSAFCDKRMACQPLYDFFQFSLLLAGERCGLSFESMIHQDLGTKWNYVKMYLNSVDKMGIAKWDGLIMEIKKEQDKVRHKDTHIPDIDKLEAVKSKCFDFFDWLNTTSIEYKKESENFDFNQTFFSRANQEIFEAEYILNQISGNNKEWIASSTPRFNYYEELAANLDEMKQSLKQSLMSRPNPSEIHCLLTLNSLVGEWNGREAVFLSKNQCPICGGKLSQSQMTFGHDSEGEPSGIHIRFGCENCEYSLNDESINF